MKRRALFCVLLSVVFATGLHARFSLTVDQPQPATDGGMVLDKGWKFSAGDDPQWKQEDFNDSAWENTPPGLLPTFVQPASKNFTGIGWFRLQFSIDTSLGEKPLALIIVPVGAAEIYLDGKLVQRFGTPSADKNQEMLPQSSGTNPVMVNFEKNSRHVLAIRFSNWQIQAQQKLLGKNSISGFSCKIDDWKDFHTNEMKVAKLVGNIFGFLLGFFAALCLLHAFLYIFFRKNRSNLYYSFFSLCMFLVCFSLARAIYTTGSGNVSDNSISYFILPLLLISLSGFLYTQFYTRTPKIFWVIVGAAVVYVSLRYFRVDGNSFIGLAFFLLVAEECIRVVIRAIFRKSDGAWIIGTGVLVAVLFPIISFVLLLIFLRDGATESSSSLDTLGFILQVMLGCSVLSISVSMSVYLARQFARTNRGLELQMIQVKELSEKTIAQEQEKKKILESQKEQLEVQVSERTAEVVQQKKEIEEKSVKLQEAYKDIRDSIHYAKRIQQAMLPVDEQWNKALPDSFVLFKPKDIVSGDFYWFATTPEKILFAAADCTGHGVPGAFMSMISSEKLNEATELSNDPSMMLHLVNRGIKKVLRQSEHDFASHNGDTASLNVNDGMDIALCGLGRNSNTLEYAGANRPLWILRENGTLEEQKATKAPIGGQTEDEQKFEKHTFSVNKGDTVYIFSDGYADQFSPTEKKLMTKRFREIILSLKGKTMPEQKIHLDTFIENWKGDLDQVDDILVIDVKI